jgi:hypothetical protein
MAAHAARCAVSITHGARSAPPPYLMGTETVGRCEQLAQWAGGGGHAAASRTVAHEQKNRWELRHLVPRAEIARRAAVDDRDDRVRLGNRNHFFLVIRLVLGIVVLVAVVVVGEPAACVDEDLVHGGGCGRAGEL